MNNKESFNQLLSGNRLGEDAVQDNKSNLDEIINQFKAAKNDDREFLFDRIIESTRYDVMEAFIDQGIANEEEIYNIALRCKLDDLRAGVDTDSLQNKIHKKALDKLDEDRIPEFYSDLIDQISLDSEGKQLQPKSEDLQELYEGLFDQISLDSEGKQLQPKSEDLQELYEGLFVAGHKEALVKLHKLLGYYIGHEGKNSEELIAAVRAGNEDKALKLISKGHYVYDFKDFSQPMGDGYKIARFFFTKTLQHPNYNLSPEYQYTPLMDACYLGDVELTKKLLAMGADVNARNDRGATAIFLAFDEINIAPKNRLGLVKELLKQKTIDLNIEYKGGSTILHFAVEKLGVEVVKDLLARGMNPNKADFYGSTPLHYASSIYAIDTLKELLKTKDIEVDPRNKDGKTPLDDAAIKGQKEIVDLLIAAGANLNLKDPFSRTALQWAAMKGHAEIVDALIAAGANVNSKDQIDRTPLICAAIQGHAEVVQKLLTHKDIDVFAKNKEGKTAADLAKTPEIKQLIEDHIKAKEQQKSDIPKPVVNIAGSVVNDMNRAIGENQNMGKGTSQQR